MKSVRQQLTKISPLSIALVVLFAAAMTYFIIGAFAASGTATMYTSPGGTQSVMTGQTFTVTVRISTAGNVPVTGASVYLSYPAGRLQVLGESYAGSPYSTQLIASDSGGTLRMDRAAFPAIAGGDQLFAQVSFKALSAGSAPISFGGSSIVTSGEDDSNILNVKNGVTYNVATPATTTPPPSTGGGGGSTGGGSVSVGTGSGGAMAGGAAHGSVGSSSGSKPSGGTTSSSSPTTTTTSGDAGSNPSSGDNSSAANQSVGTNDPSIPVSPSTASSVLITVLDSHNKPIAGAQVTIGSQVVTTDRNGVARFSNVPTGSQPVKIRYNGKNTSRTLQIKNTAATESSQSFKVSVNRNKFNPALLIVPLAILALLGGVIFIRPWDRMLAKEYAQPAAADPYMPSNMPASPLPPTPTQHQAHPAPADKDNMEAHTARQADTPGTVYSPQSDRTPPIAPSAGPESHSIDSSHEKSDT